jgi:hypothetical protein
MIPHILKSYLAATQCDKDWYKAWHAWAFANFQVLNYYESLPDPANNQVVLSHVVSSIQGKLLILSEARLFPIYFAFKRKFPSRYPSSFDSLV